MASTSHLHVEGTLTAASGELITHLEAAGPLLTWTVPSFATALTRLPPLDRSRVAHASELLAGRGLVLQVEDGTGTLLQMGMIRRSLLGWVAFGSPRIRLRRLHRWFRPALAALRS